MVILTEVARRNGRLIKYASMILLNTAQRGQRTYDMTAATTAMERHRACRGAAVLSFGFRPFFLLGALWAALAMALWVAMLTGKVALPTTFDPVTWHAQERKSTRLNSSH